MEEFRQIFDLLSGGDRAAAAIRLEALLEASPARVVTGALPGDAAAALDSVTAVVQARAAVREGRIDNLVMHGRRAVESAPDALPWLVMYAGSLLQSAFRFTGDPSLRDEALGALRRAADRVEVPGAAVPARAMMGSVHLLAGSYHSTLELCDAALDLARTCDLEDAPAAALAHQFRGYVLFEWNRLEEASAALWRAWHASGDGSGVRSGVARVMARLEAVRGRVDDAESWIGRLEQVVSGPMTLRNREWLVAVRVRQAIGSGDLHAVDEWLRTWDYTPETLQAADRGHLASRLHELDGVLAMLEATERWSDLIALAGRVHDIADEARAWFDVRALTSWAVALEQSGLELEAESRFAEALETGERGSFVRAFVEGDSSRMRILERLDGAGPAGIRARRVLAAARGSGSPRGPVALTDRQLDVLRLVERGLSNKAIARRLDLSLSTVKTHLREIFTRLDAGSRTRAVARARDLGLLRNRRSGADVAQRL